MSSEETPPIEGPGSPKKTKLRLTGASSILPLAGAGMLVCGVLSVSFAFANGGGGGGLQKKLEKAFPNTPISSVNCKAATTMCEVTAGPNVFYASRDGRYAFVGAVLDLKDRVDLTDKRIKELAAVNNIAGKLAGLPTAPAAAAAAPAAPQPASAPHLGNIKVTLPATNAIVHHPGAPLKLTAFTDLNCGYCKMMIETLKNAPDIELTEYPMEMLSAESGQKAKLALCAQDRAKSAENLYTGGEVKVSGDCASAAKMVADNTAFGKQHGIDGTPTLIRADGAANPGFMPIEQLRAWIKGAAA